MYRGRSKIVPILLMAVLAVIAIIALVSLGRAILNRGDSNVAVVEDDPAQQQLLMSEVDRSVRMTVRGPILADENFNSYRITVSPTGRNLTTFEGYQNRVLESKDFANNTVAYEEFVHALSMVDFTDRAESVGAVEDVRGVCAGGRLYTFELLQAQSVVRSSWIASCRGVEGSFKGDAVAARDLFQRQIPEASSLIRGLNL